MRLAGRHIRLIGSCAPAPPSCVARHPAFAVVALCLCFASGGVRAAQSAAAVVEPPPVAGTDKLSTDAIAAPLPARPGERFATVSRFAEAREVRDLQLSGALNLSAATAADDFGCTWAEHGSLSVDQCKHGAAFAPAGPVTASAVFDKQLAEDIEASRFATVIYVEGRRDTGTAQHDDASIERRFANSLNHGSPELTRGNTYNGCIYDGTFFSCPDPLYSIYRNLQHLFR
jgi:hypothetical protein